MVDFFSLLKFLVRATRTGRIKRGIMEMADAIVIKKPMAIISKEPILPNWNLIEHCIFRLLRNHGLQPQPAAPLPMKNIRCLGNHSEIFELTKATTISLKTERTKPILDAGNHQRAIENEFTTTRNSKNHWNHPKAVK
jgi:hypothetical protein